MFMSSQEAKMLEDSVAEADRVKADKAEAEERERLDLIEREKDMPINDVEDLFEDRYAYGYKNRESSIAS